MLILPIVPFRCLDCYQRMWFLERSWRALARSVVVLSAIALVVGLVPML